MIVYNDSKRPFRVIQIEFLAFKDKGRTENIHTKELALSLKHCCSKHGLIRGGWGGGGGGFLQGISMHYLLGYL
jgi:hypothetical protein